MPQNLVLPHMCKFALNPIQWIATSDGWLDPTLSPPLPELLKQIRDAGFTKVHAQPPAGMATKDYAAALADAGLSPAPGYLSLRLPDQGMTREEAINATRTMAAQQAELGLDVAFLATGMGKDAPRVARPGIGADFDRARFDEVVSLLDEASAVMGQEGLYPVMHPHVGTWVETEAETRELLDSIPASQMGFGPDTGHLTWAGADVKALIRDYAPRIRALHLKDCDTSVLKHAKSDTLTYQQTAVSGLWAEPGDGDLDLLGILEPLGEDWSGWIIAEVDFSALPPFESARKCAEWFALHKAPANQSIV